MGAIKLICFPYAGGSAGVYKKWEGLLGGCAEVVPIEIAGRGRRFGEPLYGSLEEALDDITGLVRNHLTGPYAVFGHSMGALLAFELCHRLKAQGTRRPEHLFVSGKSAPHLVRNVRNYYELPDEEFMEMIFKLGGTPKELMENRGLLSLFTPILKADYRIVESYRFLHTASLDCDMTVFYGDADHTRIGGVEEWTRHTSGSCSIVACSGGHFFIHESAGKVTEVIRSELEKRIPV